MDHDRVNISVTRMSCGVMELSRIDDDTDGVLYALASRLYHPSRGEPCAFFIFSDIADGSETSSTRLVDAVRNKILGPVHLIPRQENPRTGNSITVYVWAIEHKQFKEFYRKERVTRFGRVGAYSGLVS